MAASKYDIGATTWSWDELCDAELPNPHYIVKDILPAGSRLLVFGDTETYKSTVILSMAAAIAGGSAWLKKYPCRQGKVCYFSTHDMSVFEWQNDRLQPGRDQISQHVRDRIQLTHFEQVVPIEEVADLPESAMPKWVTRARAHDPLVVVVDVVGETTYLDTNKGATPGRVMSAWSKIFGFKPACIFVHHERKAGMWKGQPVDVPKQAYSGAHQWLAMVSAGIRVQKDDATLSRALTLIKARKIPDKERARIPFNIENWPFAEIGDSIWVRAWDLVEKHGPDEVDKIVKLMQKRDCTEANARKKVKQVLEVMFPEEEEDA